MGNNGLGERYDSGAVKWMMNVILRFDPEIFVRLLGRYLSGIKNSKPQFRSSVMLT